MTTNVAKLWKLANYNAVRDFQAVVSLNINVRDSDIIYPVFKHLAIISQNRRFNGATRADCFMEVEQK